MCIETLLHTKKGVYNEKCWEVQGQPFRKDSKIAQIGSVFLQISHKFKKTIAEVRSSTHNTP